MPIDKPINTISVLVENKFGVLSRVAGLFSGRGYNIHSLNVAPCEDPRFSRMKNRWGQPDVADAWPLL